jgi:putative phosphoribosyl transferase
MDAFVASSSRFHDRRDAGRRLAELPELKKYAGRDDAIVLALPRGGVPVAFEIAQALGLPLDVFLVRKLGVPGHEELAMGAIASGGTCVIDEGQVRRLELDEETIARVAAEQQRQLEERERLYREGRVLPDVAGKTVLLVDDGLATGSTMRAAIQALRAKDPAAVIVAVPTAPRETCERLHKDADEVICALTPDLFFAVGTWYEHFDQTGDDEVIALLGEAQLPPTSGRAASSAG